MTQIDLTPFCSQDGSGLRADIVAPFSSEHYTYATDGRIAVRVAMVAGTATEPPPQHDIGSKVKILEGYLSRLDEAKFEPMPEVELPPIPPYVPVPCKACAATGRIHSVSCKDCHGAGQKTCPTCDHEDDCERCHGHGVIERPATTEDDPTNVSNCDECEGTGDIGDPTDQAIVFTRVGPYWIDRKYVVLMQSLPGIEIDVANAHWAIGPDGRSIGGFECPLLFQFAGGVGAVMPLRGGPKDKSSYDEAKTDPHRGGKVLA